MIIIGWDSEYSTQWLEEMRYLKEHGIRYAFVKTDEKGITVWKYKKNYLLFKALTDFYSQVYTK